LLEAPRRRPQLRLRVPDVRHRRRDHPNHPAHGHHAPLRLVRRVERRLQLPAPRGPDADLQPREPAGGRHVNKQLLHISVFALVLLAALIVSTTYWQTWAVGSLADRKDNETALISRLTVDRGKILAADGTVLANNRRTHRHGLTTFTRHYPQNDLASTVTGYATPAGTTTGLEQSLDDYLTGANTNLSNTLKQALDKLGNRTVRGNDVHLTLRPSIQRLALDQLAGRCGAVVVLDA